MFHLSYIEEISYMYLDGAAILYNQQDKRFSSAVQLYGIAVFRFHNLRNREEPLVS